MYEYETWATAILKMLYMLLLLIKMGVLCSVERKKVYFLYLTVFYVTSTDKRVCWQT
jgi:hypothetical protein